VVRVPYFDNAEINLSEHFDLADPRTAEVLENFLKLTPAVRLRDSRHVFAYYSDVLDTVGADVIEEEMGLPASMEDIWRFVKPSVIGIWKPHPDDEDQNDYLWVEGNCGWEPEHGILLVWRNGEVLNKAGDFDGHPTNEHAYANPDLADVVYMSSSPEHITRMTE